MNSVYTIYQLLYCHSSACLVLTKLFSLAPLENLWLTHSVVFNELPYINFTIHLHELISNIPHLFINIRNMKVALVRGIGVGAVGRSPTSVVLRSIRGVAIK